MSDFWENILPLTDAELIAWLRYEANTDGYDYHGDLHEKSADRIEALTKERDDYAHKLMQANNTYTEMHLEIEQLAVTNEALIAGRDQHWDSFVHWRKQADDLTGQLAAARQDAKEAEAYAEELEQRLSICERHRDAYAECDRIGTQAVRDLEAKLAKAAEALERALKYNTAMHGGAGAYNKQIKDAIAELKGESHE